jgi:gliding motility-associated-like protein
VNSPLIQVLVHQTIGSNTIGNSQTLCSSQLPTVLTGTSPSGGNGNFSYLWQTSPDGVSWSNAAQPNSQANYTPGNVLSNTWYRRIVNSGVCAAHTSASISISIILQTSLSVNNDTICENQSATLTAVGLPSGGVYTWYTNPIQNTASITVSPQVSTTYQIQYDVAGCTSLDSAIVTVYPLPAPIIQLTGNQNFCPGDSVILSALPAGGSYLWSDGSTAQSIVVYTSGTFSVQVTDPNGCPAASAPVGLVRSNLQVSLNVMHNTCVGACDGKAQAVVIGGISPYQYQWSSSPLMVSANASSLCAGMHTLTVTDAAQCTLTLSFMVNDPPVLSITANIIDVSCFGQADGEITLNGTGGTPPYAYALNSLNFGPQSTFSLLSSGNYIAAIRDANQCIQQLNITVVQPPQLSASITYTMPLCFGDQNGTATVIPAGGTPGYSYQWLHGGTSDFVQNLATGTYLVQVTDARQCSAFTQVFIPEPSLLTASASGFDLTCNTPPDNGIGSAFATGGTAPYAYTWNAGANPNASYNTGMPSGTWQVQVSDVNGCTTYASVVLNAPVLPTAIVSRDTHFCAGTGGVPVSGSGLGGQLPYTYLWTPNNGSISNAALQTAWVNPDTSTTYYFQVIDDAGCASVPLPVYVTVYALPVVDAGPDLWYCDQGPGVFISGNVITPPGSYEVWWSPSTGLFCDTCLTTYAIPGSTQIYTLYARNRITGCSSDSTTLNSQSAVVVELRPRPVAYAGLDTTICLGGSANLCGTAANAGPLYTWQWQPNMHMSNQTVQCPTVQPPHTFTWFLVTASNGCFSTADSVTVFVSLLPAVDAGNILNICQGDSVQLQGLVQSGAAQQYTWTPGLGLSDSAVLQPMASPTQNTWYYLQARNQGCQGPMDSVQVLVHAVPIADAGRDTIVCGDQHIVQLLGSIQYNGSQPVYYDWQPGNANILQPLVQPEESQVYVLQVSAGAAPNICVSYDSVMITVLPDVQIELNADTNIICGGGAVQISVNAGVGGAGFFWSPDPGNQQQGNTMVVVSPNVSTTYTVIADEAGCKDTAGWSIQVHPEVEAYFNPSQVWGCVPFDMNVQNLSMNAHSYVWNFGDGTPKTNEKEPFHTYDSAGVYQISLVAIGTGGCRDTMIFQEYVRISDSLELEVFLVPEAPVELTLPMQPIRMYTTGAPAGTEYVWHMGDGIMRTSDEAFHIYRDTGTYFITFQAEHAAKCKTERVLGPVVIKAAELFIPNIFTPNGDGIQDVFRIEYTGDERFSIVISDRWGAQWFVSQNVFEGWDGKSKDGRIASEGVYFYSIEVGRRKEIGSFTLLR